jgi:putative protease
MEVEIGKITHYFDHIHVAVISLNAILKLGDKVHFRGHTTDFAQRIGSMEIEHHSIVWARPGENVAIKVVGPVHEHDRLFKVMEETPELQMA